MGNFLVSYVINYELHCNVVISKSFSFIFYYFRRCCI